MLRALRVGASGFLLKDTATGRTNAEIGAALHMSVATVKAHISQIMAKLSLTNRTQIALPAHDAELV